MVNYFENNIHVKIPVEIKMHIIFYNIYRQKTIYTCNDKFQEIPFK